jgi:hypothetical protein
LRAITRYPSNLISCSQPGPAGGRQARLGTHFREWDNQNVAPFFDTDSSANSGRECWPRLPVTVDQSSTSADQAITGNQDATSGRFTLTVIGGMTFVNRGTGFSQVAETTELKPGDRIFVRNGGGARIAYPDRGARFAPFLMISRSNRTAGAKRAERRGRNSVLAAALNGEDHNG